MGREIYCYNYKNKGLPRVRNRGNCRKRRDEMMEVSNGEGDCALLMKAQEGPLSIEQKS